MLKEEKKKNKQSRNTKAFHEQKTCAVNTILHGEKVKGVPETRNTARMSVVATPTEHYYKAKK